MPNPIVSLKDVRLTLASRAGPVEILRGVDLDIARRSHRHRGPVGVGQDVAADGHRRPRTGDGRQGAGRRPRLRGARRGRLALMRGAEIGIVFQSFHLVPTMTALENVALPLEFAGDGNAAETRASCWRRSASAIAWITSRAALRRRAAARRHRPGARPRRRSCSPTSRPATSTAAPACTIIDLLFGLQRRRQTTLILMTHDARSRALWTAVRMADGRIEADDGGARLVTATETLKAATPQGPRLPLLLGWPARAAWRLPASTSSSPRGARRLVIPPSERCPTRCAPGSKQGEAILGGDVTLSRTHIAGDERGARLDRPKPGRVSETATMRTMARPRTIPIRRWRN